MARPPRLDLPGIPQHIVQRGNNRMPCFFDAEDRHGYLALLQHGLGRYHVALHAYVLMTNHVHLLVTPAEPRAVSRLMQNLGRAYAQCFNARHGRSGTLWQGRFKSCLVDSDSYVLRCYRYIDLNPVRARMVQAPAAHRWSSYRGNSGARHDPLLTPHPAYLRLAGDAGQRGVAYQAVVRESLSDGELADIRSYLQQQRALGPPAFQRRVECELGRVAVLRPAHRPARIGLGVGARDATGTTLEPASSSTGVRRDERINVL